jgi:hypothetical protein
LAQETQWKENQSTESSIQTAQTALVLGFGRTVQLLRDCRSPRAGTGLSFANNQAESKGIHLPAHAWVLYLTEHRLDQMNPTRM